MDQNYNRLDVCGNDGVLYSTKDSYCEEVSKNQVDGYVECTNGCSEQECCETKCISENSNSFSNTC